jgi:hypothetical protein
LRYDCRDADWPGFCEVRNADTGERLDRVVWFDQATGEYQCHVDAPPPVFVRDEVRRLRPSGFVLLWGPKVLPEKIAWYEARIAARDCQPDVTR